MLHTRKDTACLVAARWLVEQDGLASPCGIRDGGWLILKWLIQVKYPVIQVLSITRLEWFAFDHPEGSRPIGLSFGAQEKRVVPFSVE